VKLLAAVSAGAVLLCAGCGGSGHAPAPRPKPPHLPRALAQMWSTEARAVADALDAGDGCTAKQRSEQLRSEVIAAVNAERIPARFLEPLTSAVNALPERITCTPPAPPPPAPKPHGKPKDHGHGHEHGHGKKHGHDEGGDG
jgi:hypothetical protein